jgi:Phosphotransferase enzyme family
MAFLLSSQNVIDYLIDRGHCHPREREFAQIKAKSSKNFNLLVSLRGDRHLLVKQEPHDRAGKTDGDFAKEWRIHQLLTRYCELSPIRPLISEIVDFDPDRSTIIFKYLHRYCDLGDFYSEKQTFPTAIAASIGQSLATIHRSTFNNRDYKNFLFQDTQKAIEPPKYFLRGLEAIRPGVFGQVSQENLTFFKLYQRYESFGAAIAQLKNAYQCSCLIHNDLKLDNILLYSPWEEAKTKKESLVRIIDWELFTWGDPGFDLGKMLASYLRIWLSSITISTDIDLDTALHLARTPLEALQPSLVILIEAYFNTFPDILEVRPDFFKRVMQFTGLALLRRIWLGVHRHELFGNNQICMLQVAKTLLCNPEGSIPTIFGISLSELIQNLPTLGGRGGDICSTA